MDVRPIGDAPSLDGQVGDGGNSSRSRRASSRSSVRGQLQAGLGGPSLVIADCGAASAANAGWIPLHVAAEKGHTEAIKALLGANADRNVKESFVGHTPLLRAAENDHPEAIKALLGANADPPKFTEC